MDVFKLNGKSYNVNVVELSENFSILYSENTGRTMATGAPMTLDPLGCFIGHKIVVSRKQGYETEFDNLYNFILKPRFNGIDVVIVHNQDTISYKAYVSQGERKLKRIDLQTGKILWDSLTLTIVPMKAQVIP
jgi:hypothetical protein